MKKKIAAAIILIIALPFIIYFVYSDVKFARYIKDSSEVNHKQIDSLDISAKEKRKDFDALWKVISEGIPTAEKYNDEFGYDILSDREKYWKAIENTDNDFEYFCTVQSVLNDVPLAHTGFFFPAYESITDYVCRGSDIVQTDPYLKSSSELWNKLLTGIYRESRAYVFSYSDGEYCYDYSESEVKTDKNNIVIKSINGLNPEQYISDYLSSVSLGYDEDNSKMYRKKLVFNDRKGEKLVLRVEDTFGNVTDMDVYYDLGDEYLFVMQPYIHGVYDIPSDFEIGYVSDEPDKKIVYIKLDGFSEDNRDVSRKIKEYCFEDNVSVILDLRENGGGVISETNNQLYSVLFSEDISAVGQEYILNSYGNREFFKGVYGKFNKSLYALNKVSDSNDFNAENGEYYSYEYTLEYKGLNSYAPSVWILVSDETASAADFFVSAVASSDKTVIIGENTDGEKTGCQYMTMLPESHLVYCYSDALSFNHDGTSNSLHGTAPDIRMRNTSESIFAKNDIEESGKNANKLENRLLWDDTLINTIKMIKEKTDLQ